MKAKPVRIQRSRQKKQVSPNGLEILYCGRGSKFGNPFIIGEPVGYEWLNNFDTREVTKYIIPGNRLTREDAIYLFEKYCSPDIAKLKEANKGKNLSCWCKKSDSCHADILLKLWNA